MAWGYEYPKSYFKVGLTRIEGCNSDLNAFCSLTILHLDLISDGEREIRATVRSLFLGSLFISGR